MASYCLFSLLPENLKMFILKLIISVIIITTGYITIGIFLKRKEKLTPWGNVIFFDHKSSYCRENCLKSNYRCGPDCSVYKTEFIISTIEKSRKSIDVCVYIITCPKISAALIQAFKRGVQVRIIVDKKMSWFNSKQLHLFVTEAIPFKVNVSPTTFMHHKFCIIDSTLVLTGSLNWSEKGMTGNFENLMFVNDSRTILLYKKEFNRIWNHLTR